MQGVFVVIFYSKMYFMTLGVPWSQKTSSNTFLNHINLWYTLVWLSERCDLFSPNHASEEFSVAVVLKPESKKENLIHYSGLAELEVPHNIKYTSLVCLKYNFFCYST